MIRGPLHNTADFACGVQMLKGLWCSEIELAVYCIYWLLGIIVCDFCSTAFLPLCVFFFSEHLRVRRSGIYLIFQDQIRLCIINVYITYELFLSMHFSLTSTFILARNWMCNKFACLLHVLQILLCFLFPLKTETTIYFRYRQVCSSVRFCYYYIPHNYIQAHTERQRLDVKSTLVHYWYPTFVFYEYTSILINNPAIIRNIHILQNLLIYISVLRS